MIGFYQKSVKYLEKHTPTPDKKFPGSLGLSRMQYLMDLLGNPQLKYPTIHVGGTSGKGSTSTIIASILSARYKVGLHTSPHLVKITERIKIYWKLKTQSSNVKTTAKNLKLPEQVWDISEREFVDLINHINPFVDKVEKSELGPPSYFEIVTAMAFQYFKANNVDIAVIEVGMGGKYDATNVIKPMVAVLTNVGLDHTEILGDTVEQIAEDKAGIVKPGIEVVTGVKQSSVIEIIEKKCREAGAKLSLLQIPPPRRNASHTIRGVFDAFSYCIKKIDSKGSVFDYKGERTFENLKLNLLGEHQVENASIAIRAIEELSNSQIIQLSNSQIKEGLKAAYIPGRLEIIKRNPLIVLDGAHNPDKVKALVSSIKKIFPKKKVVSIVAIKNDKNAKEMLEILLPICSEVIFTGYKIKADQGIVRSYKPNKLLELAKLFDRQHRYASRHTEVVRRMFVIPDVEKAMEKAVVIAEAGLAGKDDLILVTGSLYLVGAMKQLLRR